MKIYPTDEIGLEDIEFSDEEYDDVVHKANEPRFEVRSYKHYTIGEDPVEELMTDDWKEVRKFAVECLTSGYDVSVYDRRISWTMDFFYDRMDPLEFPTTPECIQKDKDNKSFDDIYDEALGGCKMFSIDLVPGTGKPIKKKKKKGKKMIPINNFQFDEGYDEPKEIDPDDYAEDFDGEFFSDDELFEESDDDLVDDWYSTDESVNLDEDTVKTKGGWVNKGKEGSHGKFKTKKAADDQRKAMFANGYKAEGIDYIDRQTGEVLTYKEARERFRDEYDGDDPTNGISFDEYFSEYENDDFENESICEDWYTESTELNEGTEFNLNTYQSDEVPTKEDYKEVLPGDLVTDKEEKVAGKVLYAYSIPEEDEKEKDKDMMPAAENAPDRGDYVVVDADPFGAKTLPVEDVKPIDAPLHESVDPSEEHIDESEEEEDEEIIQIDGDITYNLKDAYFYYDGKPFVSYREASEYRNEGKEDIDSDEEDNI